MKRFDVDDQEVRRQFAEEAERRFGYRIRQALNESAENLRPETLERLAMARKAALRAQKQPGPQRAVAWRPELVSSAGTGGHHPQRFGFARIGLVLSALVVIGACLTGLYQFEQQRRIEELADMDAAMLTDDLPISAYADHGFNAFLKQNP
jgi:hypothetical protein